MTQVEKIKKDIQDMETALAMPSINDMPKVKKRLEADLATAKNQLSALQKKSEIQQPATREPLPQKPELEAWAKQIEREEMQKHRDQTESEKVFEVKENRVTVGRAAEITVTIPVAEVKVAGEIRTLTQTEIVGLLKTYFKRVATGEKMQNGQYTAAYASEMGTTVWRLFDAWNLIYNQTKEGAAWPPIEDIYPGWKHAQQAYKVTADVLWRWAVRRE